jgi:4'-phosphopantetheinyl transferase
VVRVTSHGAWLPARPPVALRRNEVHVWRAGLHLPQTTLHDLQQLLSQDERERSARFRVPRNRHAFIAARGQLRSILSGYLGAPPEALHFSYGAHGKPALAAPRHERSLFFSVSHCDDLVLYGVTRKGAVGVDLERIRSGFPCREAVEQFFSPAERHAWHSLPDEQREEAFFTGWTRKEAYVKAKGDGLNSPLDLLEVPLAPSLPTSLATMRDSIDASRWTFKDLAPGADYKAAIAVESTNLRFSYRHYQA